MINSRPSKRATPIAVCEAGTALSAAGASQPLIMTANPPRTKITGTEGNNNIVGTAGNDVIAAGGGNDRVNGLAGSDTVCLGQGDDVFVDDGTGGDTMVAEAVPRWKGQPHHRQRATQRPDRRAEQRLHPRRRRHRNIRATSA
jgi:hypothetical protein